MSRRLPIVICCAAVLGAAVPAAADGPPQGISSDGYGITSPDGKVRYLALSSPRQTMVEAVSTRDGSLDTYSELRGQFAIPAIAWTVTGLSGNGKKLVLTTYPGVPNPTFVVLRAPYLERERVVTLKGNWSYDAVSPGGHWLYLIQSLGNRYLVRAYDLWRGRLLPRAIADRREEGPMTGAPITRASTRDGRWAYTLYVRGNNTAFVHALDTVRLRAVCVDLPWRDVSGWIWDARLRLDRNGKLHVLDGTSRRYAVIDTRSWKVTT